jgi:pimeloyl-ACP methyl ester carboxylesterase
LTADLNNPTSWFEQACQHPGHSRYAMVDGARLHYLIWNEDRTDLPGLVLAHGFLGHAHWWSFLAPFFTDRYRVAALDFSGMGDSGSRPSYSPVVFAHDLLGLIEHLGMQGATVIGHSFGGGRTLRACAEAPGLIGHAIMIDSYVNFEDTDGVIAAIPAPSRQYPDLETALSRFRLSPTQPVRHLELLAHIARHSLRPLANGEWTWKFDAALCSPVEADGAALLRSVQARVDLVIAETSSVVPLARAQRIVAELHHGRGPIIIPDSRHHVMLDQPLALVAALRALLA